MINLAKVLKPPSSDEAAPARFSFRWENMADCDSIFNAQFKFKHNNRKMKTMAA